MVEWAGGGGGDGGDKNGGTSQGGCMPWCATVSVAAPLPLPTPARMPHSCSPLSFASACLQVLLRLAHGHLQQLLLLHSGPAAEPGVCVVLGLVWWWWRGVQCGDSRAAGPAAHPGAARCRTTAAVWGQQGTGRQALPCCAMAVQACTLAGLDPRLPCPSGPSESSGPWWATTPLPTLLRRPRTRL